MIRIVLFVYLFYKKKHTIASYLKIVSHVVKLCPAETFKMFNGHTHNINFEDYINPNGFDIEIGREKSTYEIIFSIGIESKLKEVFVLRSDKFNDSFIIIITCEHLRAHLTQMTNSE